jgi:hypothetical protein
MVPANVRTLRAGHRIPGDESKCRFPPPAIIVRTTLLELLQTAADATSDILCGLWGCGQKVMLERHPCPCCGCLTMGRKPGGTFDLCPVCFWEDDLVQFENHDYEGGANTVSRRQAQENFRDFGASERQFLDLVRPPRPDEMPVE